MITKNSLAISLFILFNYMWTFSLGTLLFPESITKIITFLKQNPCGMERQSEGFRKRHGILLKKLGDTEIIIIFAIENHPFCTR